MFAGGNEEFIKAHEGVKVYAGSKKSPGATHLVSCIDRNRIE
jgi:hypothetical protein